jgi:hypothetical protein
MRSITEMTGGNIASITVFLLQSQFALVTMKPFLGLLNRNGGSSFIFLILLHITTLHDSKKATGRDKNRRAIRDWIQGPSNVIGWSAKLQTILLSRNIKNNLSKNIREYQVLTMMEDKWFWMQHSSSSMSNKALHHMIAIEISKLTEIIWTKLEMCSIINFSQKLGTREQK